MCERCGAAVCSTWWLLQVSGTLLSSNQSFLHVEVRAIGTAVSRCGAARSHLLVAVAGGGGRWRAGGHRRAPEGTSWRWPIGGFGWGGVWERVLACVVAVVILLATWIRGREVWALGLGPCFLNHLIERRLIPEDLHASRAGREREQEHGRRRQGAGVTHEADGWQVLLPRLRDNYHDSCVPDRQRGPSETRRRREADAM